MITVESLYENESWLNLKKAFTDLEEGIAKLNPQHLQIQLIREKMNNIRTDIFELEQRVVESGVYIDVPTQASQAIILLNSLLDAVINVQDIEKKVENYLKEKDDREENK